ncbi:MAG: adenylate/guanylate cyclase domain-containing protein [Bacteroidota bacterium]
MKKILVLTLLGCFSTGLSAQIKEVISKDNNFGINEVVLFLDILDADQRTPISADIRIQEGGKEIKRFSGQESIKVRLPINKSYQIEVRKNQYQPYLLTYDLTRFEQYEDSKDILLVHNKVKYQFKIGDVNTDRRNLRVNIRNVDGTGQQELKAINRSGTYEAELRTGETYDLEVKEPTKNFFYTETINSGTTQNNSVVIPGSKLLELDKGRQKEEAEEVKRVLGLRDSVLALKSRLDEQLNERDSLVSSRLEEELQGYDLDSLIAINRDLTRQMNEAGGQEVFVEDEESYGNILKAAKAEMLQEEQRLIEKNRAIKKKLDLVHDYLKSNPPNQEGRDTLKNFIQDLERQLARNDSIYQAIRNQSLERLGNIKLLVGYRDSFFKTYRKLLIAFGVVVAILLIIVGIFYYMARTRRKQRDQLAVLNEEIRQSKEEIEAQRDNLEELNDSLKIEREKSDELLLNILPPRIANELKISGKAKMRTYEKVSILFTDFKGFTDVASEMTPDKLMEELNDCFTGFDAIIKKHRMEKIKTIGDAYMCAGGVPEVNASNPLDAVLAGLEMQSFMERRRKEKLLEGDEYWQCRLGINTGEIRAGVIGTSKFAYDIWGNPVNIASRMESGGEVNKVNISGETYEMIKDFFECEHRGKVEVKNGLILDMYFVHRIKKELSADKMGVKPNDKFEQMAREQFGTGVLS